MTMLRKAVLGLLMLIALAWLISAGLLYARQDSVLYTGADAALTSASPNDGAIYDGHNKPWGWIAEPPVAPRATVVFFHGGAVRAEERWDFYRDYFIRRGLRVVFAEYPGYGEREGARLSFATAVPDAVALMKKVQKTYPDTPLWIAGESVGAAIAAQVGAVTDVSQVILATPWRKLSPIVAQNYPWLPTQWLLEQDYDACQALRAKPEKVRMLYTQLDEVVSVSHAKDLASCLGLSGAQVRELPRAGHQDWAVRMDTEQMNWLLGYSSN